MQSRPLSGSPTVSEDYYDGILPLSTKVNDNGTSPTITVPTIKPDFDEPEFSEVDNVLVLQETPSKDVYVTMITMEELNTALLEDRVSAYICCLLN